MDIVEGWTEPLDFELWYNKSTKLNGTGMIPVAEAVDKSGNKVPLTGATTWVNPALGLARYAPSGTEFTLSGSPYGFRIRVQSAAGTMAWWPNGPALALVVRK